MKFNRFSVTVLAVLVAVVAVYLLELQKTKTVQKDTRASYLKGGDFTLRSSGDRPFRLSQLKGVPVILYFGYTHCPDICPLGLAVIGDALNSSNDFAQVAALFVTLDPERDKLDVIDKYAGFFHKNIIGLTGTQKEIKEVSGRYGMFFMKSATADESSDYQIDHTTYYYLIDSQGELVRVLHHDITAQELAAELSNLL